MFSCAFREIFKNIYFYRTPLAAASEQQWKKRYFLGSRHPYQITAFFLSLLFPFLNTTYTKIYGRQILLKKTISLHLNCLILEN